MVGGAARTEHGRRPRRTVALRQCQRTVRRAEVTLGEYQHGRVVQRLRHLHVHTGVDLHGHGRTRKGVHKTHDAGIGITLACRYQQCGVVHQRQGNAPFTPALSHHRHHEGRVQGVETVTNDHIHQLVDGVDGGTRCIDICPRKGEGTVIQAVLIEPMPHRYGITGILCAVEIRVNGPCEHVRPELIGNDGDGLWGSG